MSPSSLVSVVVPTRNRQAAIRQCLDALDRQTYRPFEVIVVDDASTDGTPECLARLARDPGDAPVRLFRNDPQIGANPSRNRGIRESRGDLIAFLDDDAFPEPDWLDRLMRGFTTERVAAVTGRVESAPPTNLYELALKGTQRVSGRVHATRLVGCNMCVRREILDRFRLDEDRAGVSPDLSVSGRGDEDGLFLSIRAAGYEQRVVHDAVVTHHHPYTRRSFFRQGYRGGVATARLAYKYHLPPRLELVSLLLAWLTLPLIFIRPVMGLVPGFFALVFLAAIGYNELLRKAKTVWETAVTLPLVVAFFHARLAGYAREFVRLRVRKHGLRRVRLPRPGDPVRPDS
jgi:glycosyltransferase involved in cell wall biosynthesis